MQYPHHSVHRGIAKQMRYGLWLAAALPTSALAYHPLITDDTGTQGLSGANSQIVGGTGTQGVSGNQLEIGFDYAHGVSGGGVSIDRAVPFTYTRGTTETLDLFVGAPRVVSPDAGWGNLGFGAKWRFYKSEANRFSLAIKPEVLLPVSATKEAAGFGNGKTSYGLTLIFSRSTDFGELHCNLAAAHNNFADNRISDRRARYRASFAPVWAVNESWKVTLDLGLQTNPDATANARMGFVELGAIYSPSTDLDLSLGISRDVMDGAAQTRYASFGLTWRFK
jgi:hypothetical protein